MGFMRSHAKIIADADGPEAVQAICHAESINTVRSWAQRNSIPPLKWGALIDAGKTTFEELAWGAQQAAEKRRQDRASKSQPQGQAAA